MTRFIIDEWHGVTEKSKDFVKKNFHLLGKIESIECQETDVGYVTTIRGSTDVHLQTNGFACGYGGEGPHGLLWLVNEVAGGHIDIDDIVKATVFTYKSELKE